MSAVRAAVLDGRLKVRVDIPLAEEIEVEDSKLGMRLAVVEVLIELNSLRLYQRRAIDRIEAERLVEDIK